MGRRSGVVARLDIGAFRVRGVARPTGLQIHRRARRATGPCDLPATDCRMTDARDEAGESPQIAAIDTWTGLMSAERLSEGRPSPAAVGGAFSESPTIKERQQRCQSVTNIIQDRPYRLHAGGRSVHHRLVQSGKRAGDAVRGCRRDGARTCVAFDPFAHSSRPPGYERVLASDGTSIRRDRATGVRVRWRPHGGLRSSSRG